jgi:two-component system, cell cycle response regulator
MKILQIEDNPDDVRLTSILLGEASRTATLTSVGTLADGLEKIHSESWDLVLLDLGLPDSQGLATFEKLRDIGQGVPVVITSGLGDEQQADRAVRLGAQEYLVKGTFDSRRLWQAIRHARLRAQQYRWVSTLGEVNRTFADLIACFTRFSEAVRRLNEEMTPRG